MARKKTRTVQQPDPQKMRAWRAVRAFGALRPQLQNYARAMTGNPSLKVEATAGTPRTDGKTIFLTPPARLGDEILHERGRCNRRDPVTLRMLCPACDVDDVVDAGLHHELAHILFGTLEKPTPAGLESIQALIKEWHPVEACGHAAEIEARVNEFISSHDDSYVMRCNLFDGVLGILLNAFEDARVNVSMFDFRPGTRAMLASHARTLMQPEVEDDPDWVPWHERDVNSQVLIGMFLAASEEYEQIDVLCDEAKQVLWSNDLDAALVAVGRSGTVHDTVQVTVDIFRALQNQGIMVLPKCQVPEPQEQEKPDEPSEGDDIPPLDDECSGSGSPGEGGDGDSGQSQDQTDAGDGGQGGSGSGDSGSASGVPGQSAKSPDAGSASGARQEPDADGGEPDAQPVPDQSGGEGGEVPEPEASAGSSKDSRDDDDGTGSPEAGETDADGGDGPGGTDEVADPNAETGGGAAPPDDGGDAATEDSGGDGVGAGRDSDTDADATEEGPVEGDAGDNPDGDAYQEPRELDEETREAIRTVARRMTLHALFSEELPDANTEDFACGHSELHPVAEDSDGIGWTERNDKDEIEELVIALAQAGWFEEPSAEVLGVDILTFPCSEVMWNNLGQPHEQPDFFSPTEDLIGELTTTGRVTFDENKRARHERNRKSGKINSRALAKRAPFDDPRMFKKTIIPGKKSYSAVITLDCSGSTNWGQRSYSKVKLGSRRIDRIKRSAFAQAEVFNRLGIPFEMWAHTADFWEYGNYEAGSKMQLLQIKTLEDPWDDDTQLRLASVNAWSGNLDGHTLEFMRKRAELSNATDRMIIYYTDGAMPAMNSDEEGDILLRETELCRKEGIHLLAGAIDTDSPKEWGFDTVEIRSDDDLVKVMEQLGRMLLG